MIHLTRPQREALKRVYLRVVEAAMPRPIPGKASTFYVPTYREFRRKVQPYIGGDCVMVPFAGMWLGIEKDGHTHS